MFHHSLFSKLLREVLDPYIDQTHHDLLLSRVYTPASVQSYTQHLVRPCRQHSLKSLHFLLTQFSPVPTLVSGKVLHSEVRRTEEESQDVAVCCNSWKVSQQDFIAAQRSKQAQPEHGAWIALAFVGRVTPPGGLLSFFVVYPSFSVCSGEKRNFSEKTKNSYESLFINLQEKAVTCFG